jgi:hypothetical protein
MDALITKSEHTKKFRLLELIERVKVAPKILLAVYRDVQSDYRFADLEYADSNQLDEVLTKTFAWLKQARKVPSMGLLWEGIPSLEPPITPEIKTAYFTQYLPTVMGRYLGVLHLPRIHDGVDKYITHHYPHAQNWSIVGTLCDLDSVTLREENIFKNPVTIEDAQSDDLVTVIMNYESHLTDECIKPYVNNQSVYLAIAHLIMSYCKERHHEKFINPNTGIENKVKYAMDIFGKLGNYKLEQHHASQKLTEMILDHISRVCPKQAPAIDDYKKFDVFPTIS